MLQNIKISFKFLDTLPIQPPQLPIPLKFKAAGVQREAWQGGAVGEGEEEEAERVARRKYYFPCEILWFFV